jgi:hypothetical protein
MEALSLFLYYPEAFETVGPAGGDKVTLPCS